MLDLKKEVATFAEALKSANNAILFAINAIYVLTSDLIGIVICIAASSSETNRSDLNMFMHTFHKTTQYATEIVVSAIQEPNLEKDMIMTILLVMGCSEQKSSQKKTPLSSLNQHFPYVFSLFGGSQSKSEDCMPALSEE